MTQNTTITDADNGQSFTFESWGVASSYRWCPIECKARAREGRNSLLCITRSYPKCVHLLQPIPKSPTTGRIHYNIICKSPQPYRVPRRRP